MKSPYQILGVPKDAKDPEIKKAYKALAKQLHPDRNPGDSEKEERFKEVKNAYEKIKNEEARKKYEEEEFLKNYQGGQNPFKNGQGPFSSGASYHTMDEDILNEIFGSFGMGAGPNQFSGSRRRRQYREPPAQNELAKIQLSFWDAVKGGKKTITLPNSSHIELEIPQGIKNGQKLRLKGQAHKLNPTSRGDLLLEIEIIEDAKAWREGNNVYLIQDLPVDIAVEGGELGVQTPLGSFTLQIPPYTNSGKKFRLRERGIKGGDLYIQTNLVLPHDRKEQIQRRFNTSASK